MRKLKLVCGTVECINEGIAEQDSAGILLPVYCGKESLEFGVNKPNFETVIKNVDPSTKMVLLNFLNAKYVRKELLAAQFRYQLDAILEKFPNLLVSTGNLDTLRTLKKISSLYQVVAPVSTPTSKGYIDEYDYLISNSPTQLERVVKTVHDDHNVILDWDLSEAVDLTYFSGAREAIGDNNRLIVVEDGYCIKKGR